MGKKRDIKKIETYSCNGSALRQKSIRLLEEQLLDYKCPSAAQMYERAVRYTTPQRKNSEKQENHFQPGNILQVSLSQQKTFNRKESVRFKVCEFYECVT